MLIVESRPRQFADKLNRSHFAFTHRFAGHALFEIPRLIALGEKVPSAQVAVYQTDSASPGDRPREFIGEWNPGVLIASLAAGRTRLRLSGVQTCDEEYGRLHRQILDEADQLSGFALGREIGWSSMTILLSSPGMTTPYHIDHQSNLLFQLRGGKTVYVLDPHDRRVLSETTIEQYYGGDKHAPAYRDEFRGQAAGYELSPGAALHNPPLGPHWVTNGAEISASMSINYSLRESEGRARVYQVNRYLRRLGLRPTPPGQSGLRDWIKRVPTQLLAPGRPRSLQELLESRPGRLSRPMDSLWRRWRNPG